MLTATWRTSGGRWRLDCENRPGRHALVLSPSDCCPTPEVATVQTGRLENVGSVIGEILPLAVGIAISPIPIIAAILMLLSPKAKTTSVGFLLGWLAGIVIAIVLFTLLSSVLPQQDPSGSSPVAWGDQDHLGRAVAVLGGKAMARTAGRG